MSVNDQAEFAAEQREPIDRLLFIVYALLGLAVVIAVLGIVNTLALSVIERIREIGLLRAVGLSRRQLRTMLRLESVAIALLGAVLGVVVGLGFALALQRSLADDGLDVLAVPGVQLAGFVVVAGIVGRARGPLARPRRGPARRAAGDRDGVTRGPAPAGLAGRDPAVWSRARALSAAPAAGSPAPPHRSREHPHGRASASAYCDPAAPSTWPIESSEARTCCCVPRHCVTTPWNWADAVPVHASCRPVSRASITPT